MDSEVEIIVKIVQRRRKESRSENYLYFKSILWVIYEVIRMTYDFKIYILYKIFLLIFVKYILYIFLRSGLN